MTDTYQQAKQVADELVDGATNEIRRLQEELRRLKARQYEVHFSYASTDKSFDATCRMMVEAESSAQALIRALQQLEAIHPQVTDARHLRVHVMPK